MAPRERSFINDSRGKLRPQITTLNIQVLELQGQDPGPLSDSVDPNFSRKCGHRERTFLRHPTGLPAGLVTRQSHLLVYSLYTKYHSKVLMTDSPEFQRCARQRLRLMLPLDDHKLTPIRGKETSSRDLDCTPAESACLVCTCVYAVFTAVRTTYSR